MKPKASAAPVPAPAPHAVFIACAEAVVAIEADRIERLLLVDEVEMVRAPGTGGATTAGIIEIDGVRLGAWDLGSLLFDVAESYAWVVTWIARRGRRARFALRTGRCECVRPLPSWTPLPAGLRRGRASVVRGAFRTAGVEELRGRPCGYLIAPDTLLGGAELSEAESLVARAEITW